MEEKENVKRIKEREEIVTLIIGVLQRSTQTTVTYNNSHLLCLQ